jgi:hypothetical protein
MMSNLNGKNESNEYWVFSDTILAKTQEFPFRLRLFNAPQYVLAFESLPSSRLPALSNALAAILSIILS